MKLSKIETTEWVASDKETMTRESTASILLNFAGHGSQKGDTVAKLIQSLEKLDPRMQVCVLSGNEDWNEGRDGLTFFFPQERPQTKLEKATSRQVKINSDLAAIRLVELRKASSIVLTDLRKKHKMEAADRDLAGVMRAVLQVEADLRAATDPVDKADLQADLQTLHDEMTRLTSVLTSLKKS